MSVVISNSPEETAALGTMLGQLMHPGDFIALIGDLGAGKTHFVQGLARGIGVPADVCVSSPSYTLLNEYMGRVPLYHFDLYRLSGDDDIFDLGFEEYFFGEGVSVVEWADRLCAALPDTHLNIVITDCGETRRTIAVSGAGVRYEALANRLAHEWQKRV
jgi:tRNA threonylcarbamoyladenosine biosynthesis protein TsaE